MTSNQNEFDLIQRATSAPPMAEHVGASMFAMNTWGSYGQQDSPSKSNPRIPSALNALAEGNTAGDNSGGNPSMIAQPQARHSSNIAAPAPRNHPGTIGTPVHLENDSQRSKSLVDLIQEDFPRTASPMFNLNQQHHQQQQYSGGLNLNDGYMSHLHNSMSSLSMNDQMSYHQQHRSANSSPNPALYKQSDLNGPPMGYHGFQQPPLPPNYFMDSGLQSLGNSQQLQQQQQQQQRMFQSSQFNNSSYNEVLFNARGEPVGYGMPHNRGAVGQSQQHSQHPSLKELNMQSSPYLNGGGLQGQLQQPQYGGGYEGGAPGLNVPNTTGPPPGYFEEDRQRNNGGYQQNGIQQQQQNVIQQQQQQRGNIGSGGGNGNVGSSETSDTMKRLENRNDYAARVQMHMHQQPPPQQQNRNLPVTAGQNGGVMKKKGWNQVLTNGSNYEGTIEFNRQRDMNAQGGRGAPHKNGNQSGHISSNNHSRGDNHMKSGGGGGGSNNSAQTVASLLDEIRSGNSNMKNGGNGNSRNWDINKLKGNIVLFCKDQHGSRFIQQKLEVAKDDEKKLIFVEVLPQAKDLMTDVFGNYVIQKLFEYGTNEQREILLGLLLGNALELSMQMYGCRVVQKAFEVLPPPLLVPFVKEFSGDVLDCVHDQNGNHVIQKCIEVMSSSTSAKGESMSAHIQFIIDAFLGQVKTLASHPYGCRVVQRVLEHCCNSQKHAVLDELLHGGVDQLVKDQYGNYVVQHIIQYGRPADRSVVVMLIRSELFRFAQHKFASNVVEKCVQFGGQSHRSAMIDEMIAGNGPNSTLMIMIKDQYANYVIQKVIDLSDGDQLNIIANQIRENLNLVRKSTYGKHIITRLEKATGLRIDNNRSF